MNNIFLKIKNLAKFFPEIISVPLIFLFWRLIVYVFPKFYPTSGVIDESIIQVPIIAAFFLMIGNFFVYAGIKYNEPFIWSWYQKYFTDSSSSSAWLFVVMYAVRLIAFSILAVAIAS